MNKIIEEALAKLVKPEELKEISEALNTVLEDSKKELEAEYDKKLQESYEELQAEMKKIEETAYQGYQEAAGVIGDLRNRLEAQKAEFDEALEQGFEEAYQMLQAEKGKKDSVENDLYAEYDKKLSEMREFMIDRISEFFEVKSKEIYEQARRDVINDPSMASHKVALNKVVETVADYISDEEYALATSAKLEESVKSIEELKSQVRLLEARNIRINAENNKLQEQVRQQADVLKEHTAAAATDDKKERAEKAKNAQGRGRAVTDNTEVIRENTKEPETQQGDNTLVETFKAEELAALQSLAGVKTQTK